MVISIAAVQAMESLIEKDNVSAEPEKAALQKVQRLFNRHSYKSGKPKLTCIGKRLKALMAPDYISSDEED